MLLLLRPTKGEARMVRSVFGKVMWVGRATVFLVGLAVIMALVVGAATTAMGATGGNFILGKANTATTPTSLVSTLADAAKSALIVNNKSGGVALDLRVGNATTPPNSVAPMKVNSDKVVTNLNADELDGKDSAAFQSANAAAGEDLTGNYPNPQIANGAVAGGLGGEIADNSVDQNDIEDSSLRLTDMTVPVSGTVFGFSDTVAAGVCSDFDVLRNNVAVGDIPIVIASSNLPHQIEFQAFSVHTAGQIPMRYCNLSNESVPSSGQVNLKIIVFRP